MKTLKDYEKELNKCSKCGLCQSACPIFKITQNECTVSKGKFAMLLGVLKGDLKLSKNINKYLDMCLKCGKCTEFCPAGIDVCSIINSAKSDYAKTRKFSKFIFLIQNLLFNKGFNTAQKIFNPVKKSTPSENLKVLYFKGCVNKISTKTDKAISKIFKNIPIEIIEPEFECCGLPFLSEGNLEGFCNNAKHNALLFNSDYDYFVTDCASCQSTVENYKNYIDNFSIPEEKSINWGDLIAQKNIKFKFKKQITVTFHKPCHLKNYKFIEKIFKNCQNVTYTEMKDFDECCGFAGTFALKNQELAKKLIQNKTANINNTHAQYVITTCPSCLAGLKLGNPNAKVLSLLEFLASANEIIC